MDVEETSTPTRPVENVLTTKGLQEKNTTVGWDDGGKIKIINKFKLKSSHRCMKHYIQKYLFLEYDTNDDK